MRIPYNKIGLSLILVCLLANGCRINKSPEASKKAPFTDTITAETAVKKLKGEFKDDCSISNGDIPVYDSKTSKIYCKKKGLH